MRGLGRGGRGAGEVHRTGGDYRAAEVTRNVSTDMETKLSATERSEPLL